MIDASFPGCRPGRYHPHFVRPNFGSSVELHHASGIAYAAEVVFLTDGYVALTRPDDYPPGDIPSAEAFDLIWPADEAVHVQPVTVSERPGRGTEIVWEAVTAGEARTEERRPHARVQLHTQLTMTAQTDPPLTTSEAMLTDLSEDSLRGAVYGREWSDLRPGTPMRVGFVADNVYFEVDGSVLRTYASTSEDDDGVEVIVLLDTDEQTTRDLRQAVLAERQGS